LEEIWVAGGGILNANNCIVTNTMHVKTCFNISLGIFLSAYPELGMKVGRKLLCYKREGSV
jgi:hypothetical protein